MNLQQSYDLTKVRVEIGKKIENEIDPLKRTA
jgi:plasmid maintenance system antidote protein VapI